MPSLPDYESHLAAAVLNDSRIISYRLLSRELKIHSNAAKRMLFEFHRKQNAKKEGSVHATYLLDGIPKPITVAAQANGHAQDGEDLPMQSSPFVSSAVQEDDRVEEYAVPSRSIILAREEDLEGAKSKLETIHSIHIYSLQPNKLQNLQVLSDCNRTISTNFNSEDPLIVGQKYGVIHNSSVRRRTARHPPPGVAPSIAAAPKAAVKAAAAKVLDSTKSTPKASTASTEDSAVKSENPSSSSRPPSKATNKPSTLKKEHSDIFKSFSKTKAPLRKETSDASTLNSPAPHSQESSKQREDEPMMRDDDDDQEDTYAPENKADPSARTARSQRAEQLRKMMDDDDSNDESQPQDNNDDGDSQMHDVDAEPPSPSPPTQKSPTPEPPPPVVSGGRRRGRRKVMKKKTVKDEEGYLVTKEEAAWESFSEEERAPVVASSSFSKGKKVSGGGAGVGGGGKAGGGKGDIMSFFGKK